MGGKLQCKACNIPSVRSIRVIQHLVYRGFSPHVRRLRPWVAFVTRGHCDDLRAVEAHAWRTLGVIRQCDRMVHCRGGVGLLSQRRNTIGVCFRRGQNSTWLSAQGRFAQIAAHPRCGTGIHMTPGATCVPGVRKRRRSHQATLRLKLTTDGNLTAFPLRGQSLIVAREVA